MQTLNTLFERELVKRISEELTLQRQRLESPGYVLSHEVYRQMIGEITQLKKVVEEYIPDVVKAINER
jgi:hypothetical protein